MRTLIPFILFGLLIISCGKDDEMEIKTFDSYESGAYVVNRGTAGVSPGSVSYYISDCLQGTNNIFEAANGTSIPDELRDLVFTGNGEVLLLTPSQIIVATETDFVQSRTIGGLSNAQQIIMISPTVAYVSQYNAPGQGFGVLVINLITGDIIEELLPGKSTKNMISQGTSIYTANTGGNFIDSTISKINALTHETSTTLEVGPRPTDLAIDATGSIWVLCEGVINNFVNPEAPENVPGALVRLTNDVIVNSLTMGSGARNLTSDKAGQNMIYVNKNWTYSLPIEAVSTPLIPLFTNSFNGYDLDPISGLLYGANSGDFVENGSIWIYNVGTKDTIATFPVGIAPMEVVFR